MSAERGSDISEIIDHNPDAFAQRNLFDDLRNSSFQELQPGQQICADDHEMLVACQQRKLFFMRHGGDQQIRCRHRLTRGAELCAESGGDIPMLRSEGQPARKTKARS